MRGVARRLDGEDAKPPLGVASLPFAAIGGSGKLLSLPIRGLGHDDIVP